MVRLASQSYPVTSMAKQPSAGRTNPLLGSALEAAASRIFIPGYADENPKGIETTSSSTGAFVCLKGSWHQHVLPFIMFYHLYIMYCICAANILGDGLCSLLEGVGQATSLLRYSFSSSKLMNPSCEASISLSAMELYRGYTCFSGGAGHFQLTSTPGNVVKGKRALRDSFPCSTKNPS